MAESVVMMTIRLPLDLRDELEKEAEEKNVPMSDVFKEALWEHIKARQQGKLI